MTTDMQLLESLKNSSDFISYEDWMMQQHLASLIADMDAYSNSPEGIEAIKAAEALADERLAAAQAHIEAEAPAWRAREAEDKWFANSCTRCGGGGMIGQYRHVEGGTCFKCHGTGQKSGGLSAEDLAFIKKHNPAILG